MAKTPTSVKVTLLIPLHDNDGDPFDLVTLNTIAWFSKKSGEWFSDVVPDGGTR